MTLCFALFNRAGYAVQYVAFSGRPEWIRAHAEHYLARAHGDRTPVEIAIDEFTTLTREPH